ncbi:diguanylate cyclase domain-containing protein [Roseateles oligotrophus]|uniref:Diguanylate cyclase n=1 Tax=Roseateles oligotrophus TaxID=1769250 RepID=A0ABT2YH62_9BURK|nr:diguanylate cyclase [Roseateles oligotrophus]MCV2369374.1 diguanylate cyclase [Roseateles oligotrophus]
MDPYQVALHPNLPFDVDELNHHILQSVTDGIHVIDLKGTVLIENRASSLMLGWCGDCLVGKSGHAAIHHHHADGTEFPAHECPIYATLNDGIAREVDDDVFWRQDGSSFPVQYRTAALCNPDGVRYGVTVVFRDITERKRAGLMQQTLHGIANCAHDCESPAALYPQVHRMISALLSNDHFCIALFDEVNELLSFPYWVDARSSALAPVPLAQGGRVAEVIQQDRAILLNGVQMAGHVPHDWLGVPLRASKRVIGALVVKSEDPARPYTEADRDLLQFVSTQLATSIERTQKESQLRRMAQFDALTDLPNRSLFDDRLLAALQQAHRRSEHLALMFIDLDKFKPVNDKFGHATGDALLKMVADRLKTLLRTSDTVGRIGGDEFVAVLHPLAGAKDAGLVAEKIRQTLSEPFSLTGGLYLEISASIGVAIYTGAAAGGPNAIGPAELARIADAAMYRAKRSGGNAWIVAD